MLLAFGDTHRSSHAIEKIATILNRDKPQLFLHNGDNYADYQRLLRDSQVPGYGVRGNCDSPLLLGAPEELTIIYEGFKILLVHGHKYSVKNSLSLLIQRAKELNARAVVFGHSHVQMIKDLDGVLLLNPGSIPLPRGESKPGYGKLMLKNGNLEGEIVSFD